MEELVKLLKQLDPSLTPEDVAGIKRFAMELPKEFPFLNEEDIQQIMLMQGVTQGLLSQPEYDQIVSNRETPSNIPQLMAQAGGDAGGSASAQFSAINKLVGGQ